MIDLPPCAAEFADYYRVPYEIVQAVATQEGGWPGAKIGPNKNGTYDLGVMQINTIWFDEKNPVNLSKFGITEELVRNDACTNIAMGTWVLHQNYNRFQNWWQAVAAYNAGPGNWEAGMGYARKVRGHLTKILASR
jgi:soluble lytic murein transglycosylase-like protein